MLLKVLPKHSKTERRHVIMDKVVSMTRPKQAYRWSARVLASSWEFGVLTVS